MRNIEFFNNHLTSIPLQREVSLIALTSIDLDITARHIVQFQIHFRSCSEAIPPVRLEVSLDHGGTWKLLVYLNEKHDVIVPTTVYYCHTKWRLITVPILDDVVSM